MAACMASPCEPSVPVYQRRPRFIVCSCRLSVASSTTGLLALDFGRGGAFVRAMSPACCSQCKPQALHACGQTQSPGAARMPSSPLLPPRAGYRVKWDLLQPCNVRMGSSARHPLLGVGAGAGRASMEHLDARRVSCVRHVRLGWIPARAATS
ncbi:hypothetical protein FXO37_29084 [Capsicum annuum]|nr:hypothetical protein FXO37_29084 [Capsicum annuum]